MIICSNSKLEPKQIVFLTYMENKNFRNFVLEVEEEGKLEKMLKFYQSSSKMIDQSIFKTHLRFTRNIVIFPVRIDMDSSSTPYRILDRILNEKMDVSPTTQSKHFQNNLKLRQQERPYYIKFQDFSSEISPKS